MKITISDSKDLTRLFENTIFPQQNENNPFLEIVVDCPEAVTYTNMFLNSNLNARVRITPPVVDRITYAGLFSMCKELNHQPFMDTSKCRSMAAMFKGCESMRFAVHFLNTSNVGDMRQMFWGAKNFAGNGIQAFDFSSLANPNCMRNFMGGGASIRQIYYDKVIENLHNQMKAGTLPTPMYAVDMGGSQYSPYYAEMRQEIIDYGWEILDGGQIVPTVEPSKFEAEFYDSVFNRITNDPDNWMDGVDMSCHTRSSRGGILISPRHMLYTYHYKPGIGTKVVFWNGQEGIIEDVDIFPAQKWGDIVLARLKEPVVGANPVLFLQKDWRKQCPLLGTYGPPSPFPRMKNTPLVWVDNGNRICTSSVSFITEWPNMPNRVVTAVPENPVFLLKYKDARPGDSGSPQCFLYKNRFVLSHLITEAGAAPGSWVNLKELRDYIDSQLEAHGENVDILE